MGQPSPLFVVENVVKKYGKFVALDNISFSIEGGAIALLGPNGSGKTTLIKLLLGLLPIQSGKASVLGYNIPDDIYRVRQVIGYMPENDSFPPDLKAIQYVTFAGQLCGLPEKESIKRAHEVLEFVGLKDARYRKLGEFSTGMKQRVKLAQSIVHGAEVVFLDEPANGLDPTGRIEMLALLREVRDSGINILLSTHLLGDVQQLCDSVILMNQGNILYQGKIDELYEQSAFLIKVNAGNKNSLYAAKLREEGFSVTEGDIYLVVQTNNEEEKKKLLEIAVKHDILLSHFEATEESLEDAFIKRIRFDRN